MKNKNREQVFSLCETNQTTNRPMDGPADGLPRTNQPTNSNKKETKQKEVYVHKNKLKQAMVHRGGLTTQQAGI